ncbi:MAG: hypothetical protein EA355_06460 [Rhodobacteraceae bacterium]|nr:MAG: hypothetical protein EA355_06460 [Paracoccaceae bacterium]
MSGPRFNGFRRPASILTPPRRVGGQQNSD